MEKHGIKKVIQEIPLEEDFPKVLSSRSSRLRRFGLVKVSKRASWNFVAVLLKRRLGIQRYLEMEDIGVGKAIFLVEEKEWMQIWEPKAWRYRDVNLCVSQWTGDGGPKTKVPENSEKESVRKKEGVAFLLEKPQNICIDSKLGG